MKISQETLDILSNFSQINRSIAVNPGNTLKTRSENSDSPTAKAIIEDEFPTEFAIYELKNFLAVVSLFNDPNFEFNQTSVKITEEDGSNSAVYRYCDRLNIVVPNFEKDHKLPEIDAEADITYAQIQQILRSASLLKKNEIAFAGDGKNLFMKTQDSLLNANKGDSNSFSIKIGETDKKFNYIFNVNNFAFMKNNYKVAMCLRGIFQFTTEDEKLTYWVAPSNKSSKG